MGKKIGIDLGTANTLVYVGGRGIVMRAPSVVAVDQQTKRVLAVGSGAKKMIGKTPGSIVAYRPVRDGVIADFDVTSLMLQRFLRRVDAGSFFNRPSVIVGMPCGINEVEKRAIEDATFEGGARSVALIEEPIAAAIGSGLRVAGPRGSMIVDVGGGTTEMAVIALGGMVVSRSLNVAGDSFDADIIRYIRSERGILIGEATAELLKIHVGSAHKKVNRGSINVYGRSMKTGHGVEFTVSSGEICEAVSDGVMKIIAAIKSTLEETPPELSADIYDFGIMLTGGGSLLGGLDKKITDETSLRVTYAKHPFDSVCVGIGRVIDSTGSLSGAVRFRQR